MSFAHIGEELGLLRKLVKDRMSPRSCEAERGRPAICPICHAKTFTDYLVHEASCYWSKKGVRHVRGRQLKDGSGEYGMYARFEWLEETLGDPLGG